MIIIHMENVSKFYNGVKVLDKISLEIEGGERIVILGPSGCGKTTVLRLLAGFIAPDKGRIHIGGELVAEDGHIIRQPEQRNLGMVFQDLALWPHLSVLGNMEFALKVRGMDRKERLERCRSLLSMVDMAGFENRKPAELSGGQQQRIALVRALVSEPRVLLMDEPLSSLDAALNVRLRGEILRLQQKLGFTLLYVTHNREEALDMATYLIMMNKGRIERIEPAIEK